MVTQKRTVSVRLDRGAERRLEKAAQITRQSRGAFLEKAGDESARRVLLEWATERYRQGGASFSELAAESGLAIEEIMAALGQRERQEGLEMFLDSCRTIAEAQGKPEFLRLAEQVVREVSAAR
jgi:hypothetical protein